MRPLKMLLRLCVLLGVAFLARAEGPPPEPRTALIIGNSAYFFAPLKNPINDAEAMASALEEMQGGTFTISNGGIYGSLLSTPILNAPQSGILGMHRIEERAVVRDGQIVAWPMMYLALSYDHRLVDGKEAVAFLMQIKDAIQDPKRLVLDL